MNPENSGLLSVPPPPLPPPPLPPLPLQHLSCRLLTNLHPGNREEDNVIDLIKKAPLFFDFREEEIERYSFISLYNKAPSILQEGPTCGLIAAKIAAASLAIQDVQVQDLLQLAREMGFSNHGEMFSAANLAKIVEKAIPVDVSVREFEYHLMSRKPKITPFLEHLSKGWPILIAYDADFNHYPCKKAGHRAHWAVLLGYCIASMSQDDKFLGKFKPYCDEDEISKGLYHYRKGTKLPNDIEPLLFDNMVSFYAKQGKSSHLHLFRFDTLIESNMSLREANPKKVENLVLPETSVTQALSNQALFIKPIQTV